MKSVQPTVQLLTYTSKAEEVIERAARTCYNSVHKHNPPKSTKKLLQEIIQLGHHSVLEHGLVTFIVKGSSRVLSHELVRHRIGCSYSMESQRYVRYNKEENTKLRKRKTDKPYTYVTPTTISKLSIEDSKIPDDSGNSLDYYTLVKLCWEYYEHLLSLGVPPEDARYILPNGTTTEITVSMNLRALRHFFMLRCHKRAHWEIRKVAIALLKILKKKFPNVFFDFILDPTKTFATCKYPT